MPRRRRDRSRRAGRCCAASSRSDDCAGGTRPCRLARTRMKLPGTLPPNVQNVYSTPSEMSLSTSRTSSSTMTLAGCVAIGRRRHVRWRREDGLDRCALRRPEVTLHRAARLCRGVGISASPRCLRNRETGDGQADDRGDIKLMHALSFEARGCPERGVIPRVRLLRHRDRAQASRRQTTLRDAVSG